MTVIRVKHDNNYVVLNKEILENPHISLKSKGFWAYCMSKPDDWDFYVRQLISTLREGETAIRQCIRELEGSGYIAKTRKRDGTGRFGSYDYEIYETSRLKEKVPCGGFPHVEDPHVENQALLSNDYLLSTKSTKKESSLKRAKEKSADASCVYGKFVKLTDVEYSSLVQKFGKDRINAKIEEMNDYISSTGRKPYEDYAATLRNWFRKETTTGESSNSSSDENKELAKKIISKFKKQVDDNHIQIQERSLLFVYGTVWEEILFTENGFKDRVFSRLRKMNLPTDGL